MKKIFISFLTLATAGLLAFSGTLFYYSRNLPSLEAIVKYDPRLVTKVYSIDDKLISEYSTERRLPLEYSDMPKAIVDAFVSAEDADFFIHKGINPITILRAAIKNFRAGRRVQGGSTITQQVVKSVVLGPEKSIARKIREILLAFKLERSLSKEQILALYLNHIFLGSGAYGVEAATQAYFSKSVRDITIPEAAILAGLPRAPSRDNPHASPERAKNRQRYVLRRLLEDKKITQSQHDEFVKTPIRIRNSRERETPTGAYFAEYVRQYLVRTYGQEAVYGGGLEVHTTLNLTWQKAAEEAIRVGLLAVDKREGLRRPKQNLDSETKRKEFCEKQHLELVRKFHDYKLLTETGQLVDPVVEGEPTPLQIGKNYSAVFLGVDKVSRALLVRVGNVSGKIMPEDYKWVSLANPTEIYEEKIIRQPAQELRIGDIITVQPRIINADGKTEFFLEQDPLLQGALLSYNIPDGAISTMVGGLDFKLSEFNRATQAKRQSGSVFKPFIFSAALDAGLTPATIIVDSPIVYRSEDEKLKMETSWKPENYGRIFYGDTSLRDSLAFSRNIPTIKLLQHLGVQSVVEYIRKLGVTSPLNEDLSLALGSSTLTMDELLRAWGVFANKGYRLNPYTIRKVVDSKGNILEEHTPKEAERIIPETTAYLMTNLLQSVVDYGTAAEALKGFDRPVAAKTGTTNEYRDALFVGYIPQIISGVWVGFDSNQTIGPNEPGGRAAAPIWRQYMQTVTADMPVKEFEQPPEIIKVSVDAETGDVPNQQTKKRRLELFLKDNAPVVASEQGLNSQQVVSVYKPQIITGYKDLAGANERERGGTEEHTPNVNTEQIFRDDF